VTAPTRSERRPPAYLVRPLSIVPAKWARSVRCAAMLALVSCAAAPPPAPAAPPPAPTEPAPPREPGDLVVWEGADATEIACFLTETHVEVPEAWRAEVRQISPTEVIWQPAGERGAALLVRGADHRMTTGDGLEDMKRLFELIGVPLPKDASGNSGDLAADLANEALLPSLDFIDLNSTRAEIEQEPPGTGTLVLGYRIVVSGDATCRLATAALKSDPRAQMLAEFLDAVDTPRPTDPTSLSFIHPAPAPKIPPAVCKGWPVWMFPTCRPASLPPTQAGKKH